MFEWSFQDGDGNELGRSGSFESQADAEAWFGAHWEELGADGTTHVALIDGASAEIYRMGLAAEG